MIALNRPAEAGRAVDELLSTVSASRLSTWLQCRLKFWYRYVLAIPVPPSPAIHVGKVVHAVLQQWNLSRWRGLPFADEAAQAVFEEHWSRAASLEYQGKEEKLKRTSLALTLKYLHTMPAATLPEAVECRLQAELPGMPTLVGVLDLVQSGRIVDYKTSASLPVRAQILQRHELQAAIYGVLYRANTDSRESAVEFHHLVKTSTPKIAVTVFEPVTERQMTRLFRLLDSYVSGVQREDFVPSPGIQCMSCEYLHHCRRWEGYRNPDQ